MRSFLLSAFNELIMKFSVCLEYLENLERYELITSQTEQRTTSTLGNQIFGCHGDATFL